MQGLIFPAASQRLMSVGGGLLFFGRGVEHREAVEVAALHVERADGEHGPGVAAGHENEPAAGGEQRHGNFEVRLAERFPPNIDAVGGSFFHAGGDVFRFVVDGDVGPELAATFQFFFAAGRGDHFRADRLGHLHDHRADAAGAAVDEQRFAGFELGVAHQAQVGSDADERAGGGRFVAHAVGNWIEPALIDGGVLGKRALPAEQALVGSPHAVADFEALRVGTNFLDDARQVAADDERQRDVHRDRAGCGCTCRPG